MGRKVGKNFYFKKKFCPIFYFMTHLFPKAQLKNRGVEAQGHKKKYFNCFIYVLLNQIRDNHIFTKDWQWLRRKEKKTESAAFCRVGRVTGNNNKFLLGHVLSVVCFSRRTCIWILLGFHFCVIKIWTWMISEFMSEGYFSKSGFKGIVEQCFYFKESELFGATCYQSLLRCKNEALKKLHFISIIKCFKEVKNDQWLDLLYSFSTIECCTC